MTVSEPQKLSLPVFSLCLRALVAALGECARPPWWKTEFMTETGFRFLERLYPRSYFRAAVHAAGQAACQIHDNAVGRLGVYHLFRLPESLEVEMYRVPSSADEEFVNEFRMSLGDATRLLNMLGTLCGPAPGTEIGFGARRLGTASDLGNSSALTKVAMFYFNAFGHGQSGFPYFVTEP